MSFKENLKIKQTISLKSIGVLRDNFGNESKQEVLEKLLKIIKKERGGA
jgi:hypothetical protein